jgi:hypothetical protein
MNWSTRTAAWMACAIGLGLATARAGEKDAGPETRPGAPATAPSAPTTAPATRPAPKPLSENVKKGLAYLVSTQQPGGAWAQGDESAAMGNTLDKFKASPNVADTCMAVMALLRGGTTPNGGEYQDQVLKGLRFICEQVSQADEKDLYVTGLRGTRTQMKLGVYIDTFMAAQVLAEVKNVMPDEAGTKRVGDALAKVVRKIEINQAQDGRWAGGGWAPVLAQGQAAKSLNVAVQNGAAVNEKTRDAVEQVARADFAAMGDKGGPAVRGSTAADPTTPVVLSASGAVFGRGVGGAGGAGGGDAGVELYSRAAQVAGMQASANTNGTLRDRYASIAASPTTQPADRAAAQAMLKRFGDNDKDLAKAQDALLDRLQDKRFVAGFGSNGGEEFLSYLNIGESLILKGGDSWHKWDTSISDNLNRIQNGDGSWSGEHCITGRTFCTAAALMVLTIDRSPVPVTPSINKAKEH